MLEVATSLRNTNRGTNQQTAINWVTTNKPKELYEQSCPKTSSAMTHPLDQVRLETQGSKQNFNASINYHHSIE